MEKSLWQRGIAILTGIYVSRMLGMFMVFPVFFLYARELEHATPFLVGVALGAYGLSQGLLQIPFGILSDRFGRKTLIVIGLCLFLLGTVIAALADSIYMMILGRIVQGMGAISSVCLAYASDISPPEKRGMVMAIIGGSIGMAFVLALILGPVLSPYVGGVSGLFWLIAVLVVIALFATYFLPKVEQKEAPAENYSRKKLLWACFAVGMLHATFTGSFAVIPSVLLDAGLDKMHHWWVYLPANLLALCFMRYKATPHPLSFAFSFFLMLIAYAFFMIGASLWMAILANILFFIGFYRLETGLPHWVSSFADSQSRGRAMGIFSTVQFLSSFVGAAVCGAILQISSSIYIVFAVLFLLSALSMLVLLFVGKHDTLMHS